MQFQIAREAGTNAGKEERKAEHGSQIYPIKSMKEEEKKKQEKYT